MKGIKNGLNRREFLARSIKIGVAGIPALKLGFSETLPDNDKSTQNTEIIYREIGKTGMKVPLVNMGVMNSFSEEMVRFAYKKGVRLFDTAAVYQNGNNEKMLGRVLKDLGDRDEVFIGTKVFLPRTRRGISGEKIKEFFMDSVKKSLKNLQTNYIDILYVHAIYTKEFLDNKHVLEVLKELKKKQIIRFSGFSTHSNMAELINHTAETGNFDVIQTAFNYSMSNDVDLLKAFSNAKKNGVGLVAMKTQCMQPWYKQYEPEKSLSFYDGDINHVALLKWVLNNKDISCAIPGVTTFEQLEDDFQIAYNLSYSEDEKKFLRNRNVKLAMEGVCSQCGNCNKTCPENVEIKDLIRSHMYAFSYGNFSESKRVLGGNKRKNKLSSCAECSSCVAKCSRRVNIPGRIEEIKSLYC